MYLKWWADSCGSLLPHKPLVINIRIWMSLGTASAIRKQLQCYTVFCLHLDSTNHEQQTMSIAAYETRWASRDGPWTA